MGAESGRLFRPYILFVVVAVPFCIGQSCGTTSPIGTVAENPDEQVLGYQPDDPSLQPGDGNDDPGNGGAATPYQPPYVPPYVPPYQPPVVEPPVEPDPGLLFEVVASKVKGPAPLNVTLSPRMINDEPLPDAWYFWDFGDGDTAEGPYVSHVYQSAGTYTVVLCIALGSAAGCSDTSPQAAALSTGGDSWASKATLPITATEPAIVHANSPPTVYDASATVQAGTATTLTLTGDDPAGLNLTFFVISAPSHGSLGVFDNTPADRATVVYTPASGYTGPDSFTFKATNGVVNSPNTAVMSLTVQPAQVNAPPVARAGADQVVHDTDRDGYGSVDLDGTASTDSDGTIVSYVWKNGSTVISNQATARVALPLGVHTVSLTVTDNRGGASADSLQVVVNSPPTANAGPDQTLPNPNAQASLSVTLDGRGSTDSDGTIATYTWREGSTVLATGANPTLTLLGGLHTITLTVTDNRGGTSADTVVISIATPFTVDAGPDADVDSTDGDNQASVTLTAAAQGTPAPVITTYRWSKGSTTLYSGPNATATVTLPTGVHALTLTATDNRGITVTDEKVVYVQERLLAPGTGWTGETPQPDPVGYDLALPEAQRPAGWDAKSIARWDVVPYQTFDGDFNVGVVAFHMNDIDRVEFSVNGGPWLPVYRMTRNVQTANHSDIGVQTDGIVEYWATLRAGSFAADGPVEVRAIAWPKIGVPRVLQGLAWTDYTMNRGEHSLVLNADSRHTLPVYERYVSQARGDDTTGDGTSAKPFATISKACHSIAVASGQNNLNGGLILLEAGDYEYIVDRSMAEPNRATARLVTLRPANGVARSDVRLVNGVHPGLWRSFVQIRNLSIAPRDATVIRGNGGFVWCDNVVFVGMGYSISHLNANTGSPLFWSDSSVVNAQAAFRAVTFARNVSAKSIGEDAFKFTDAMINANVSNLLEVQGSGWHNDVWQYYGTDAARPAENLIVYGLRAVDGITSQGVGPTHVRDVVFADVEVDNTVLNPATSYQNWQAWGVQHHVYVRNSRFIGKNYFRSDATTPLNARNVVIENSVFNNVLSPQQGVTFR